MIAGPPTFTDREVIADNLIDAMLWANPSQIITSDQLGVDEIITQLVTSYTNIKFSKYYIYKDKFGKSALPIALFEMTAKATHILIFDDNKMTDVEYFANRNGLMIMKVKV